MYVTSTVERDHCTYEFGRFRVDPAEHLLFSDGKPVQLTAKAFQALLVLIRSSGHLVEKSALVDAVWGHDTFVEEGNVAVTISMIRKALGDDRSTHKYIETVPKQGYRFVSDVSKVFRPQPETSMGLAASPDPEPDHISAMAFGSRVEVDPTACEDSLVAVAAPHRPTRPAALGALDWIGRLRCFHPATRVSAAIGVACVFVVAGIILKLKSEPPVASAAHVNIRSLAIMPFHTSTTNPDYTHLGVAVADELITRLGPRGNIEISPTSAVEVYGRGPIDAPPIENAKPVDAIMTGSVVTSVDWVRVNARVVAANGSTLWTGTFEKPISQVFELEDQLEASVAQSLFTEKTPQPATTEAARDPEAYRLYVQGRFFWNKRTPNGLRRGVEYFQQALRKDPAYADAYAGLADCYTLMASFGVEPAQEAYPNAKAAALKALQIDPSLADAHASLGFVYFYYEWNWGKAKDEFQRAIQLNPDYAYEHTWYALMLSATGQRDEATRQIQIAQQLDPLSLMSDTEVGRVYYWNRQYDKAVAAFRHVIDLDPYFARAHLRLGIAYIAQGNYADAIREFHETSRLSGPDPYLDGFIGYAQALSGDAGAARKTLADLIQRSRHNEYVPAFSIALIYAGLGDHEQALEWFAQSYQDRSTYMVYANVDPLFDGVRSDQRFTALLQRMQFPEIAAAEVPAPATLAMHRSTVLSK
jgi:DNA-binding winged helix-turn-helix (wHTH) protein/tetratricopeptide (TPR) repeat protein/TolB-like protein